MGEWHVEGAEDAVMEQHHNIYPQFESVGSTEIEVGPLLSTINAARRALESAVAEARRMTDLEDNWDGEDSPGYSADTFQRVDQLVCELFDTSLRYRALISVPQIAPADNGSIDVRWVTETRKLIVNVPADLQEMASFFGEDAHSGKIYGHLPVEVASSDVAHLAGWLSKK